MDPPDFQQGGYPLESACRISCQRRDKSTPLGREKPVATG